MLGCSAQEADGLFVFNDTRGTHSGVACFVSFMVHGEPAGVAEMITFIFNVFFRF